MKMINTRPTSFEEVVGLESIKNIIHYDFVGCQKLNQSMPHVILMGPAGTGKSTIAKIISSLTGGHILEYIGPDIKGETDVYSMSDICEDNDIIYIEEAHGIGKRAQIVLLEWMENYKVFIEPGESSPAPKVSFIFATTNSNKLSKPFRERCKILNTYYYEISDIKEIIRRAASKLNLDVSNDDALTLLAKSSRGTPRIAVSHRLDAIHKIMVVDNLPFNIDSVRKMLQINGINEWGLNHTDIRYCKIILDNNKPVAQKTIAHALGIEVEAIEPIEQYLLQIGVIKITAKGRVLTELGIQLIGNDSRI